MWGVLVLWISIFVVSMVVLIKSSDFFTDAAEKVGKHLNFPSFIIGVVIVSIGTSLPELVSSTIAVFGGEAGIMVGNVVGSNITNVFLVLGVVSILAGHIKLSHNIMKIDLPLLIGSAFVISLMLYDGVFTVPEAIVSLIGFIIYIAYASSVESKEKTQIKKKSEKLEEKSRNESKPVWKAWVVLIVSSIFIYFGAEWTINSIIKLSSLIDVGTEVIATSAVALGTSLPELMVSLTALKRNRVEMAVGNVLGSNIFNSFAVLGIPSILGTSIIGPISFNYPLLMIVMMVIASLLYLFMTMDSEVTKWEGWTLILFYLFFLGKLFGLI